MNFLKHSVLAFALTATSLAGSVGTAAAQGQKTGYTNMRLLFAAMPEAAGIQQTLQTHERKLQENMNVKRSYAQGKLEEYQQLMADKKLSPEERAAKEKELEQLQAELQKYQEEMQGSFQKKQEELTAPVIEKIKKNIDELAATEGYAYILDQQVVLHGPAGDDISERVLKRMGVQMPKPAPAGAPKPAATPAPAKPAPK
jgi:outer membrane protein